MEVPARVVFAACNGVVSLSFRSSLGLTSPPFCFFLPLATIFIVALSTPTPDRPSSTPPSPTSETRKVNREGTGLTTSNPKPWAAMSEANRE